MKKTTLFVERMQNAIELEWYHIQSELKELRDVVKFYGSSEWDSGVKAREALEKFNGRNLSCLKQRQ